MAQLPKRQQELPMEDNAFTSFEEILNVDSSEIDRPKPAPAGTYDAMVDGLPEYGKSSKKQTPYIQWNIKLMTPKDDVSLDDLQAAGGIHNKYTRFTVWLPNGKADRYKINDFCDKCGVPQGNLQDRVDQTPNCYIGIVLKHTILDDNNTVAEVKKTFSIVE